MYARDPNKRMKEIPVPQCPEGLDKKTWNTAFASGVFYALDLINIETSGCNYGDAYAGALENVSAFVAGNFKEE